MTFHIAAWIIGLVAFFVVFAVMCASVWESESDRERELSELKASIRRAEEDARKE
jgi:cytochrome c biogenesis factor